MVFLFCTSRAAAQNRSSSAASLSPIIRRLSGIYRDPQRVLRDAESLLSSPLGNNLHPTTKPLLNNDGTSTPPVLVLSGTLPMEYEGVTYNLPIEVFLPPLYPSKSPTVFVRPVATMVIREYHRHVALDGQVYMPYLHEWSPNTHNLTVLAVWMSRTFGRDPPCYDKPVAPANSPPPPSDPVTFDSSNGSKVADEETIKISPTGIPANLTNCKSDLALSLLHTTRTSLHHRMQRLEQDMATAKQIALTAVRNGMMPSALLHMRRLKAAENENKRCASLISNLDAIEFRLQQAKDNVQLILTYTVLEKAFHDIRTASGIGGVDVEELAFALQREMEAIHLMSLGVDAIGSHLTTKGSLL